MITGSMIERASKSKEAFLREAEKLSEEEAVKLDYLCMLKNRKANLTAVSSKINNKIVNENNLLLYILTLFPE